MQFKMIVVVGKEDEGTSEVEKELLASKQVGCIEYNNL